MEHWGMPSGSEERAREWLETVMNTSYYTQAVVCKYVREGQDGCIVFVSTALSTRTAKENYLRNILGMPITDPSWMYYSVWWYRGLLVNNHRGITDFRFNGTEIYPVSRNFFEAEFLARGIQQWEQQAHVSQGHHRGPFRRLLVSLGVEVWIEYTFGFSFQAYLSAYMYI